MDASSAPQPHGSDVDVDWASGREANLMNWNDRAVLHEQAYGLDAYRADPGYMSQVVRTDLEQLLPHLPNQSLAGLVLCHLQCHIGTDTVSLARAGARVTGVDFSPVALDVARRLATELGVEGTWVETDVLDARAAVDGDFDVVYTSIGTIGWLADLDRWAAQVAGLLRPGGVFYIRDGHPMMLSLDDTADSPTLGYRYFHDGRAITFVDEGTYIGDGKVAHPRSYEWPHPLSEIVTALLGVGLRIDALHEGKTLPWPFVQRMTERPDGDFEFPAAERDLVPCTFTIIAHKA